MDAPKENSGSSGSILSGIIPAQSYVCVEYPGRVRNTNEAVKTLCGSDCVVKSAETNRPLRLFLRPEDPFCRPLYGSVSQTKRILIKVTQRIKNKDAATNEGMDMTENKQPSDFEAKVVGTIGKVIRYEEMGDFQYLLEPEDAVIVAKKSLTPDLETPFNPFQETRDEPLHLHIPAISHNPKPIKYNFQSNLYFKKFLESGLPPEEVIRSIKKVKSKLNRSMIIISFQSTDPVPSQASSQIPPPNENEEAYILIKNIFIERPVVSRLYLQAKLPTEHHAKLRRLLPYFSYIFQSGPWRSFYIRFGYDPRASAESRIYQVFDFRTPPAFSNFIQRLRPNDLKSANSILHQGEEYPSRNASNARTTTTDFISFSALPQQRQIFFQVCDLEGQDIQGIVQTEYPGVAEPDEKYGWYPPFVTTKLKEIMKKRFYDLIRAAGYDPASLVAKKHQRAPIRNHHKQRARRTEEASRQLTITGVPRESIGTTLKEGGWTKLSNLDVLSKSATDISNAEEPFTKEPIPDYGNDVQAQGVTKIYEETAVNESDSLDSNEDFDSLDSNEDEDEDERPLTDSDEVGGETEIEGEAEAGTGAEADYPFGEVSGQVDQDEYTPDEVLPTPPVRIHPNAFRGTRSLDGSMHGRSQVHDTDSHKRKQQRYENAHFFDAKDDPRPNKPSLPAAKPPEAPSGPQLDGRRLRSELSFLSSLNQTFKSTPASERDKDVFQVYEDNEDLE